MNFIDLLSQIGSYWPTTEQWQNSSQVIKILGGILGLWLLARINGNIKKLQELIEEDIRINAGPN